MFNRLRLRLTVVCSLATGLILAGMSCASLLILERQLAQRGQAAFSGDFNSILYHLRSQTMLDHTWYAQTEAASNLILCVTDSGRPLLYQGVVEYGRRDELRELARQIALEEHGFDSAHPPSGSVLLQTVEFVMKDAGGQTYYTALASIPAQRGWMGVVVIKSQRPEQLQMARLRLVFVALTLLCAALLWLFAWVFTRYAIRPVEESRRRQVEFVAAASHELRSPLAVIQSSAQSLPDAPPGQALRFARTIEDECGRLARLVSDMLTLAGADNGAWSVLFDDVDLETLLLDAAEHFELQAKAKGIRLSASLPEEPLPKFRCDRYRVAQVLAVLLDNALSYTGEGGVVRIWAEPCRRGARLCVSDSGSGVPDDQKELIFERFYRADAARSKRDHYGLGLSIAREIAAAHHGSLTVEDTPGGGATFVFSLPANQK